MIRLSATDLQQLVALLERVPLLATERDRRNLIALAGLEQLLPQLDLSGSAFTASSHLVSYLTAYGRLTYDQEALGILLAIVKNFVGIDQQTYIEKLLVTYDMLVPERRSAQKPVWRGTDKAEDLNEKIIGENTLRPIWFLTAALETSRSVAYVEVSSNATRWSGTAFMISQSVAITNEHVIDPSNLPHCFFRFNYEETRDGSAKHVDDYRPKTGGIFHTNRDLDYAVIELEGEPGLKWGWLSPSSGSIGIGDRANIIQHPNGQSKQISLQNNRIEYVDGNRIQYVTSTQPGSSGSPVLNDAWEVIAIHHSGGDLLEPGTQRRYFRNEGIRIDRIVADLPASIRIQILAPAT